MDKPKYLYKVLVEDTLSGGSERRFYKTRAKADAYFDQLNRSTRRNGHNTVLMVEVETGTVVRFA